MANKRVTPNWTTDHELMGKRVSHKHVKGSTGVIVEVDVRDGQAFGLRYRLDKPFIDPDGGKHVMGQVLLSSADVTG